MDGFTNTEYYYIETEPLETEPKGSQGSVKYTLLEEEDYED